MKLIVGLGNPGKQYEFTRHNAGFLALDFFLKDKEVISCQSKFKAEICEYHDGREKIFFVKPQSFMNLSGGVVSQLLSFYKLDAEKDLLVVHDDKDVVFGKIKTTQESGGAGHNGVQNIIDELGSRKFHRIRIGVESREADSPMPTDEFVLQRFSKEELEELEANLFSETSKLIQEFTKEK